MNRKMNLSDIKINSAFEATIPGAEKMLGCRNNYLTTGKQDRYIVVNHDSELIDGYIMYLTLKELDINEAEIIVSERRKKCWRRKNIEGFKPLNHRKILTTYIYGVHPSVKYACGYSKEFVWRVPESWIGWADDLLPGDIIYADTKRGVAPVVVTRIERLNECPVDMKVRKVISKIKKKQLIC